MRTPGADLRFPRIRVGAQIKYGSKCLTSIPDLAWSDCLDGDGFTWRFHKRDSKRGWDYWEIKDRYDRFCLDVEGFSRANVGRVILWHCNGGLNQLWRTRH